MTIVKKIALHCDRCDDAFDDDDQQSALSLLAKAEAYGWRRHDPGGPDHQRNWIDVCSNCIAYKGINAALADINEMRALAERIRNP